MNYLQIYHNLLDKRRNFPVEKSTYQEHHHCLPRCLGGSNDSDNIVSLTAREHYIAHLLLVKIYQNDLDKQKYYKMLYALECMTILQDPSRYGLDYNRKFKMNSKLFEFIKIKISEAKSYINKLRWSKMTIDEKQNLSDLISKSIKEYYRTHKSKWIGRKHTSITIEKMKISAKTKLIKGKYNPNYNKIWICNDNTKECIQWDKDKCLPEGWRKGRIFKSKESYQKLSHPNYASTLGKIWIHDNFGNDKCINSNEEIPLGWTKGRTLSKTGNHRKLTIEERQHLSKVMTEKKFNRM